MFAATLKDLELDASEQIGYTLKCLGAGFWAFRQEDFREAIEAITMEVVQYIELKDRFLTYSLTTITVFSLTVY